ncbi:MAG: DUF58 domain-containing protein [Pirellulaceae bacterium]
MPLRRRAWLSREGVYYAGVLAFIVGGAVLRSINPLVILAGMMIAPLLLNWRLVMASLLGVWVRRQLPEQISAGEPLTVEIAIENSRRSLSSWLLVVEDWIERVEQPHEKMPSARGWSSAWRWLRSLVFHASTRAEALAVEVPAGQTTTITYRLTLPRRGRYRFGPLRVSTRFPLGLVWGHVVLPAADELVVSPRLGRLTQAWASLLEGERTGDQRHHPQQGLSAGDYYGLRPWQSGDSTRWIHWRTTAKLGVPTVMQFERQQSRDVVLVLDPWLPAAPSEQDQGHLELAISMAATAVVELTSRGHSRLVLGVVGSRPQCWSGPSSPLFCHEVLGQLAELPASDGSALDQTLRQVREEAPPGAGLVVISSRPAAAGLDEAGRRAWIDVSGPGLAALFQLE